MPDITYAKQEDIPEVFRADAVEKNGAFVVDVSLTKKVTEFRDTNVALRQEMEVLKPQHAGYKAIVGDDPEKFKGELATLRDVHQQVLDGKLKGSTAVKEEVEARLASVKTGYEDQIKAVSTKAQQIEAVAQAWENKFKRLSLQQQLTIAATAKESGALPEALPDIIASGEQDWKVQDDGTLVRMNGDAKVYGPSGDPMSPKEWLADLLKRKPYFAKPSAGGGATGGRDGQAPNGMSAADFQNLPPQERIRIARAAKTAR